MYLYQLTVLSVRSSLRVDATGILGKRASLFLFRALGAQNPSFLQFNNFLGV